MDMLDHALNLAVDDAAVAAQSAAASAACAFADQAVGTGPLPGTPEWDAEQQTDAAGQRSLAWHVVSLRVQLAAGLDGLETVIGMRHLGASWALIGRAADMTRQSAHERWGSRSVAVLDRYGTGLPAGVPNDGPIG